MRLFVTGDVHGDSGYRKIEKFLLKSDNKFTYDDCLLICGDFGILSDNGENDEYHMELYSQLPCRILWVDGNHENFDLLCKFPQEDWLGGKVHKISDNILHLMRGEIFKLPMNEGVLTFFTFGGAKSTDRGYDTGFNDYWWAQELPSEEEINNGINNLLQHGNRVDYIFTHEAPQSILSSFFGIERDYDVTFNSFLEKIAVDVEFKGWFFGHHHNDIRKKNFFLIYNKIVEIKLSKS